MMTSSPSREAPVAGPGLRAQVVLLVSPTPAPGEDHDAMVVALHGRSMATCDVEASGHPGAFEAEVQRLVCLVEAIARQGEAAGVRVGLCTERELASLALAVALRCPSLQALVLMGGDADGLDQRQAAGLPPCLFVLGPSDLDQLQRDRAACQGSASRHRLEVLPREDEPLPLCLAELGDRKARLAAQWFVRHLTEVEAGPLPAPLPFQAGGPARLAAPHLAALLAPRHSELGEGRV